VDLVVFVLGGHAKGVSVKINEHGRGNDGREERYIPYKATSKVKGELICIICMTWLHVSEEMRRQSRGESGRRKE
jgi:hypothetical protein